MTATPGFTRSFQSLIPFGLPLRTRKTIVEVYGELLCGSRFCQSSAIRPRFGDGVDVVGQRQGHHVGLRPSITERACLPEPPCDCLMVTVWPLLRLPVARRTPR